MERKASFYLPNNPDDIAVPHNLVLEFMKEVRKMPGFENVDERFFQLVKNYLHGPVSFDFSIYGAICFPNEIGNIDDIQFITDALKITKQHKIIGDGVYKEMSQLDFNAPGEYVVALDGRAVLCIERAKTTWASQYSTTTIYEFDGRQKGPGKLEHVVNLHINPDQKRAHRIDISVCFEGRFADAFRESYEGLEQEYLAVGEQVKTE